MTGVFITTGLRHRGIIDASLVVLSLEGDSSIGKAQMQTTKGIASEVGAPRVKATAGYSSALPVEKARDVVDKIFGERNVSRINALVFGG